MVSHPQYEIKWSSQAWEDMQYHAKHNKKLVVRVRKLIESMKINPYEGIGKPEPLKHSLTGCWSRRIDITHRLVYEVEGNVIQLLNARYHYTK